jgi:hypothetical protein
MKTHDEDLVEVHVLNSFNGEGVDVVLSEGAPNGAREREGVHIIVNGRSTVKIVHKN